MPLCLQSLRRTAAAAVLGLAAAASWSQGQIDHFQASASQVVAGSTVWFDLGWRIDGSFSSGGGNNPVAPEPAEGLQDWVMNWYWTESLTATGIELQAGGLFNGEQFSLTAGQGASGQWGFALLLDTPGVVDVWAGGAFSMRQTSTWESELATRYCSHAGDPDGGTVLVCDSWSYTYPVMVSEREIIGLLNTPSLQVEVLAVPEPAAAVLMLAGLGMLAGRARAQASRTGTRGASAHISS